VGSGLPRVARTTLLEFPRATSPETPISFAELVIAEADKMHRGRKAMIIVVNAKLKTVFLMPILITSYYISMTGKFKLKLTHWVVLSETKDLHFLSERCIIA
jgi:hypothetical protein